MCVRTVCGERNRRSATALRPSPATMHRSTSRSRGVRDSTSRSLSVRCLRAAVNSRRTPVRSAGGRCVSSRSTPDDGEQPGQRAVLGDPPGRARLEGQRGPARIVLLGEDDDPYARLARTHAHHERYAVHEPVLAAVRDGHGHGCRTRAGDMRMAPRSASTRSTSNLRPSAAARSRQRSAAGPLPAADTSTSGSAARAAASDSAKIRWSSTTRTRMRTTETPTGRGTPGANTAPGACPGLHLGRGVAAARPPPR